VRAERTGAVLAALDRLPASQQRAVLRALPALERLVEQLSEDRR
jgi:hypothetical protein